jgi:hypothetical protein
MRRGTYPWGILGFLLVCTVGLVSQLVWLVATHDPAAGRALVLVGALVVFVWLAAAWRGRQLLRRHRAVVRLRPGWDVRTAVGNASLPWHLGRLGTAAVTFPQGDYAVSVALGPDCVELWRGDEPVVVLSVAAERIAGVTVQRVRVSLLPVPGVVLDVGGEPISLAPARREGGVRTARRADVEAWAALIARHVGAGTGTAIPGEHA